jgi:hypothetical protein
MSVRGVAVVFALAGVAVACFLYLKPGHSTATGASRPLAAQVSGAGDCPQCARLAEQIDNLQRSLADIQSKLASQQVPQFARRGTEAGAPKSSQTDSDLNEIEAIRAADAEKGVAQSFNMEKTDSAWANNVSARVNAALSSDEALRDIAHKVECRQETCRLEIDDDGSTNLSGRLPIIALGLADVLPNVSVEPVNQDGGRGTLVLYMTSRRTNLQAK